MTLMSISVGASIGLEAHPETDQFLRLDAGRGRVKMGPAKGTRLEKPLSSPSGRKYGAPINARTAVVRVALIEQMKRDAAEARRLLA